MLKVVVFILMAIIVVQSAWDHNDYRDIKSCDGRPHTFWVYRTEQPAAACDAVIKVGLTPMEKRKILDMHNELRQKVAKGEEKRGKPGPQPPAHNMRRMQWDEELADLAQRWVNQCNFNKDQCRNVERFEVNQNYGYHQVKDKFMDVTVESIINAWYNDVSEFDAKSISSFNYKNENQSHYTQFVWADSYTLGCGAIRYPVPNWKRLSLVCNYGPGGNINGQPVYRIF